MTCPDPFAPQGNDPWTPEERAFIRDLMCIPLLNASANSEMENVMNTINGLYTNANDLGATQARIRFWMSKVKGIDIQISTQTQLTLATEVSDEIKFDAKKQIEYLKIEGNMYIGRISRQLGLLPRDDYYAEAPVSAPDGDYLSRENYEVIVSSFVSVMGKGSHGSRRSRHK